MPLATSLVAHLSMASAPAPTPEPTQGTAARSHSAASVPSSPCGPCSAGSATAQLRRIAIADGSVIRWPSRHHQPSGSMVSATTS